MAENSYCRHWRCQAWPSSRTLPPFFAYFAVPAFDLRIGRGPFPMFLVPRPTLRTDNQAPNSIFHWKGKARKVFAEARMSCDPGRRPSRFTVLAPENKNPVQRGIGRGAPWIPRANFTALARVPASECWMSRDPAAFQPLSLRGLRLIAFAEPGFPETLIRFLTS